MREKLQNPEIKTRRLRKVGRGFMALCMTASAGLFLPASARPERAINMPQIGARPVDDDTLTFMSANVHGWKNPSGGDNVDQLIGTLRDEDVDVACLQEVFVRGGQLNKLYEAGYSVIFAETKMYTFMGQFGNAVISKSPIRLQQVYNLPPNGSGQPRNAMSVEIATEQGPFELVNTHLSYVNAEANTQNRAVLAMAHRLNTSVLCGDLNQTPSELDDAGYDNAFYVTMANTMPESFPTYRRHRRRTIDFVLDRCRIDTGQAEQFRAADIGSDHFAIIREVQIEPCE